MRDQHLIQNAAAWVLTKTRKYDHISPVLRFLHWLLVAHRPDGPIWTTLDYKKLRNRFFLVSRVGTKHSELLNFLQLKSESLPDDIRQTFTLTTATLFGSVSDCWKSFVCTLNYVGGLTVFWTYLDLPHSRIIHVVLCTQTGRTFK